MQTSTRIESPQENNKTLILVIVSIIAFFSSFQFSAVNIALPFINRDFNADAITLTWVSTAQSLTLGVFLLLFGRISDILGIKKVFTAGLIILTIGAVAAGFSTSIGMLIGFGIIMGIGGAMTIGNTTAIVAAIYPDNERGKALGINIAAVYVGLSAGPVLGGFLTAYLSWRSIYLCALIPGILGIISFLWKIKGELIGAKKEKFDYPGSIIYGLALISLMYGFSILPGLAGGILTLIGIIGFIIFFKWESRSTSPIIDINIFRNNRIFLFSTISNLIGYSAASAITFLLSLYLQYIQGFNPEIAGLILIAQPIMQAVLSPVTGRLSDKIEARILASAGMALIFTGLFMFIFLSNDTSVFFIIAALIILGIGFALFSSPNTSAALGSVSRQSYGVASGVLSTTRSIGQTLSMGITMIVIAIVIGRVVITQQYYPEFLTSAKIAFGVFSALCLVGIFTSMVRGKTRK